MKTVRKLVTEQIIRKLEEIRRISTMDTATFSQIHPPDDLPKSENEVDKFIKSRTRLWRGSWITDPLTDAIHDLKKETKRV